MSLKQKVSTLSKTLQETIIGQEILIERLLLALFADGHLLVEGAPGLAKTKSIKALSSLIDGDFHRIQFTPDLLPADITGTEIYRPQDMSFVFQKGPIFHNLILADEINRAPAKVQSALLEAMGERQISIGQKTYPLPKLFLVMATQNPIEHEGVFLLPEAQLDRFMMHVRIDYPDATHEKAILKLNRQEAIDEKFAAIKKPILLSEADIFAIRKEIYSIHMDPAILEYIVQIIMCTRQPQKYNEKLAALIEYGSSPRGSIFMDRCARTIAWMRERDFVTPKDIHDVTHEILRHRIGLSFEAESLGMNADKIIDEILSVVPLP